MIDYDEGRDYEMEDQDRIDQQMELSRMIKSSSAYKTSHFIRGLVISILLLLIVIFVNASSITHYEDGSGTITISYCVPFTLCDK